MEPDLRAFLTADPTQRSPQGAAPALLRPPLAGRPPLVAPPSRPAAAPSNNNHTPVAIADVFLSTKEEEAPAAAEPEEKETQEAAAEPADQEAATPVDESPEPKINEVTLDEIAEIGDDGKVASTFPPAPIARPRRRMAEVEMPSLGILDVLMEDDDVHDILICGTQPIYVDVAGQLIDSGMRYHTHEEVWNLAEQIMDTIGQRWSGDRPMIDTRLPDGSRVNIVAPPMAVDGVSISIRKFPAIHVTLERMVENKQMTPELASFLSHAVASKLNIIVSGGTSSGKTTLLNALSAAISPKERIVTIEDSAELRLQQPHVVRLESKPPMSIDQPETAVSIRDLVKNALRMRPDRIVVGESRGAEAFDVLQAMNTGHDGSMTTLHANAPRDGLVRLETMVSLGMPQIPSRIVRQQIASTVHLMIQMSRGKDGQRRITHISEIAGIEGETIMMQDLITFNDGSNGRPVEYRWVGGSPRNGNVTEAARQSGMLRGLR